MSAQPSTKLQKLPGDDLGFQVASLIKTVLMDCPLIQEPRTAFTATVTPGGVIEFPKLSVDWRSVTISPKVGYSIKTAAPDGTLCATLVPQKQGEYSIPDYKGYTVSLVATQTPVALDLFSYFGGPTLPANRLPIVMTVLDNNKTQITRYMGSSESVDLVGDICIYSSADSGGVVAARNEASKIFRWARSNRFMFGSVGLQHFQVEPPITNVYDNRLSEVSIPFKCRVTLEPAHA